MTLTVRWVQFLRGREGVFARVELEQDTPTGAINSVTLVMTEREGNWYRERIGKRVELKANDL